MSGNFIALILGDKEKTTASTEKSTVPVCVWKIEGPRNIDSQFRTNTPPFHHLRHTRGLALHITLVIAYLCVCYIVTYLYNVL